MGGRGDAGLSEHLLPSACCRGPVCSAGGRVALPSSGSSSPSGVGSAGASPLAEASLVTAWMEGPGDREGAGHTQSDMDNLFSDQFDLSCNSAPALRPSQAVQAALLQTWAGAFPETPCVPPCSAKPSCVPQHSQRADLSNKT